MSASADPPSPFNAADTRPQEETSPGSTSPASSDPPAPATSTDALEGEIALWKDTALRARADLDNFRKRMAQEMTEARKFANASLLEELLPILDNFHFGLQAAENDAGAKHILVGLKMVAGQFQTFLRDQGVEEVAAVGHPFDPNRHEAVSQQSSPTVPEGWVISQARRGFILRERLLRPATVIVSTGPETA